MYKVVVPVSVATNHLAGLSVPLQETVALPETLVQPVELTAVFGARVIQVMPVDVVSSRVIRAFAVPLAKRTQASEVRTCPLTTLLVTSCNGPAQAAVRAAAW